MLTMPFAFTRGRLTAAGGPFAPGPPTASGASSAAAEAIIAPELTLTISTVGGVVTAAVALVRTGCTNRTKLFALTAATAEAGRAVTVTLDAPTGVSAVFSTVPFTTKYCPFGPAVIGP